jgi:predicted lipoprotein with Yx(FWY)xxD motif
MRKILPYSILFVFALVLSACGTAATPAPVLPTGPATVNVGQNATLGSLLVDSQGMTLYLYTTDTPNKSNCYGPCAVAWPPLLTAGAPIAGSGVTASLLGTTTRTDGTTQVTYNGWPLYYFQTDKAAGDTTGENVQNVWFVITPAGVKK